ncbi:S1 family peptidase [Photobacterium atrarenae]|uniref:Serine protease n=1 Tax=Photobacterium atrarenae TaxID=865757 RepID=A0ABY5GE14_9GAMM|nr:serine protease [Photobacterium atrarenae]UTV27168.1 serine protease [Photobacterium atrarenae]
MYKLLFGLLLYWFFVCSATAVASEESARPGTVTAKIVGGVESGQQDIPWQVYLNLTFPASDGGQSTFVCGGVAVSQDLVLTAAHCLQHGSVTVTADNVRVWGGIVSLFSANSRNAVAVTELVIHPSYNSAQFTNDIALLKLAEPLPEGAIPIRMADRATQDRVDNAFANSWVANGERPPNLLVSGWGSTDPQDSNSGSSTLRYTLLSGVPDRTCDAQWGANMNSGDYPIFLCAGSVAPDLARDSCFGDSGGPLVWQDPQAAGDADFGLRLVGLVSFGNGCAVTVPGVYTEVAEYQSWIDAQAGRTLRSQSTPVFSVNLLDGDIGNAGSGIAVTTPDSGDSGGSIGLWLLAGLLLMALWRCDL